MKINLMQVKDVPESISARLSDDICCAKTLTVIRNKIIDGIQIDIRKSKEREECLDDEENHCEVNSHKIHGCDTTGPLSDEDICNITGLSLKDTKVAINKLESLCIIMATRKSESDYYWYWILDNYYLE